jgi:hypothetical protein
MVCTCWDKCKKNKTSYTEKENTHTFKKPTKAKKKVELSKYIKNSRKIKKHDKNASAGLDLSVGQIMKSTGHTRGANSMFWGNIQGKEQARQEKIINAIIDNDQSDWYNSTYASQSKKRRTFSTFDTPSSMKSKVPESEKRLSRHLTKLF